MSQTGFLALNDRFPTNKLIFTNASSSLTRFLNYSLAFAIESLIKDYNCRLVIWNELEGLFSLKAKKKPFMISQAPLDRMG
jgi:hypothetical protein